MASIVSLASFDGADGSDPEAGLVADAAGNLYGTTAAGGASGFGTVFEIARTATGYASTPITLASFGGTDGDQPHGRLVADAAGNLFGTTQLGGASGFGTVFEIARTATGYASTPTTLVSFKATNGSYPAAGLIVDAAGNLYGTTSAGGAFTYGTVFEVAKTATGYASAPKTLVSFTNTDVVNPAAGLIADAAGNLYGTGSSGGDLGYGGVFEIARTATGYRSTATTLVSFQSTDGAYPYAGLIADAAGNLFGTTVGGGASGGGTVFEIAKTATGYSSTPMTLVSFGSTNGSGISGLIADADGNLYGTITPFGGTADGTVFKIAKTVSGYSATATTLASFSGTDGSSPVEGLIADADGTLYGTTSSGGSSNSGTVFEVLNAGFVTCYCPGTLILTAAGDVPVEQIEIGDMLVTAAGVHRPVKWIGRRAYAARFTKANPALRPIRIAAGALGDGVPRRDLLVSPKHALYLDGVLVPAEALVNGRSVVVAEPGERIDYIHVELDSHDVILAEGAPAESFANDWGCRGQFHNGAEYARLYPGEEPQRAVLYAPRHDDGPVVEAIWRWVADRAGLPRSGAPAYGGLQGFVERIEDGLLHGWARNERHPDAPVDLEVLLDGAVVARVLAERYRSDLAVAGLGAGYHSFRLPIPGATSPADLARVTVRRAADAMPLPTLDPAPQAAAA